MWNGVFLHHSVSGSSLRAICPGHTSPGTVRSNPTSLVFLFSSDQSPACSQILRNPVGWKYQARLQRSSVLIPVNAWFSLRPQHLAFGPSLSGKEVLFPDTKPSSHDCRNQVSMPEELGRLLQAGSPGQEHTRGLGSWKPALRIAGSLAEHSPLAGQTCLPPGRKPQK